jgi:hypothetical protein
MDDTDKLLAGLFAATMTARLSVATVKEFWTFYDSCEKVIIEREAKSKATTAQKSRESWDQL